MPRSWVPPCGPHTEQGRLCTASRAGGCWGRAPLCALRPGAPPHPRHGRGSRLLSPCCPLWAPGAGESGAQSCRRARRSRPGRSRPGRERPQGRKPRGGGRRRERRENRRKGARTEGGGAEEGPRGGGTPWDRGGGTAQGLGSETPAVTPTPQPSRSQKEAVHLRCLPEVGNWGAGAGQSGLGRGEGEG